MGKSKQANRTRRAAARGRSKSGRSKQMHSRHSTRRLHHSKKSQVKKSSRSRDDRSRRAAGPPLPTDPTDLIGKYAVDENGKLVGVVDYDPRDNEYSTIYISPFLKEGQKLGYSPRWAFYEEGLLRALSEDEEASIALANEERLAHRGFYIPFTPVRTALDEIEANKGRSKPYMEAKELRRWLRLELEDSS